MYLITLIYIVLRAVTVLAQEEVPPPPIGLSSEKLWALIVFLAKGVATIIFIFVMGAFVIKMLVHGGETSTMPGPWGKQRGWIGIMENIKGLVFFFGVIAFIAWLPDLLNWLGVLPESWKPYVLNWNALFGK